jgi:lipopolysaccharide biosynthesis glycosyltransferase
MIELACIADGAYLRHAGVMLHSALACTASERISVHLLHSAPVSEEDRDRLAGLVSRFGGRLRLVGIDTQTVADFPSGYFPRSVWYRILLPELMPDADKVLYLDADIIVDDDLGPLWHTDVGTHLLGAVTNPFYPFMPDYPRLQLDITRPADYFNSGVLLMNLARMRAENAIGQARKIAVEHSGSLYPDQDALNIICRDRWLHLHPRWNVQSTLFDLPAESLPLPSQEVLEAVARPAVIHFIGPFKPWHYLCRHPRQALYFEHARQTPWGVPALEGRSLKNMVLRRLPLAWIDRWFRFEQVLHRCLRRLTGQRHRLAAVS